MFMNTSCYVLFLDTYNTIIDIIILIDNIGTHLIVIAITRSKYNDNGCK